MRRFDDDTMDIIEKMISNFFGNASLGIHRDEYSTSQSDDVDIFEDEKKIYITVELKLDDEDINVTPQKDGILLEVMYGGRWRKWKINIPTECRPESAKISFNNCVLDIELEKVVEDDRKGE